MNSEEIKAAVLAECERLWKQRLDSDPRSYWDPETNPKNFIDGLYPLSVTPLDVAFPDNKYWEISPQTGHSAGFTPIQLARDGSNPEHMNWELAYRLLNLGQYPEKPKLTLSNLPFQDQGGISRDWLEIWEEIENWYGDPKKRETTKQLLLRLQTKYASESPAKDPQPLVDAIQKIVDTGRMVALHDGELADGILSELEMELAKWREGK